MNDKQVLKDEIIVIIGASHAGVQLAASLRESGFDGIIKLVSDEAHIPYHRPPLSKAYLKDPDQQVQVLRGEDFYSDNGIDLIRSRRVVKIDLENSRVELDNGEYLAYSKLCIATGARPRELDIAGIDAKGIYQLRDCDDAQVLREAAGVHKSAVVVGGGFIGLEAAATLHGLGLEVTVVEAAPRLMGRVVAPQLSQFVLERFRDLGIAVFLDTPISEIETEKDRAVAVICGKKHFVADMVLIGIGVVPNVELAQAAGLEIGNGISVDENFETSAKNVYAIGDVAEYQHWLTGTRIRLESVQNATDQARNLADTMVGRRQPYRVVPWFWSDQADMKIQMVGLSHNSTTVVTRQNPQRGAISAFHYDEGENLVAIDTVNAPADHMAGRKLIAEGISPSREQAADKDFRLKGLLG